MGEVRYTIEDGIAIITIDYPPVNALGRAMRTDVAAALTRAEEDLDVQAIVLVGSNKNFIAGADITEFANNGFLDQPTLSDLQQKLLASAKLTIAAIRGHALGGGLELALTCHARVADSTARLGLPEVKLGILPGAGGTQRLTRLVGPQIAADWLVSGKQVSAEMALSSGLVDAVVDVIPGGAIDFAKIALNEGRKFLPVLERPMPEFDADIIERLRAQATKRARGALAPLAIIDCVEAALKKPAEEGLNFEKARCHGLIEGDQSAALRHYFFAERQARKVPDVGPNVKPRPIASAAVIGSGTMGGGIAMVFANAGIPVKLVDISQEALDKGLGMVARNYEISVGRGSMAQGTADKALSLITGTISYADLADVDIAVEAVFEKMDLKKAIFAQLDAVMKPGAVLATNTSSLNIDEIASATTRPEDVIGVHFFSPANVMKLQENVRGSKSSPETIATVMELGKTLGKVVVLAGNCDGFIGNRMLQYYTGEAEFLLEQGATPEQIDRVAEKFGMPMGPISMRDMTGMDVGVLVRKERQKTMPAGERMSPILERLVEQGRIGMKSGKGFYRYEGRDKYPDPEAIRIIESVSAEYGITRRTFSDEEVEARMFAPLVNEGAKELEDGTAIRAGDIDVAWVNGYGFPAHKGGPMYWGEKYGLDKIYAFALEAEKRNGPRWAPGKLLERLAREGKGWDAA